MRAILIAILVVRLSACSPSNQYKNATEFEAVVKSWQLVEKSEHDAIAILVEKNFSCRERSCYREARGIVCNQRQRITLIVGEDQKVREAAVWKFPGEQLPGVCL